MPRFHASRSGIIIIQHPSEYYVLHNTYKNVFLCRTWLRTCHSTQEGWWNSVLMQCMMNLQWKLHDYIRRPLLFKWKKKLHGTRQQRQRVKKQYNREFVFNSSPMAFWYYQTKSLSSSDFCYSHSLAYTHIYIFEIFGWCRFRNMFIQLSLCVCCMCFSVCNFHWCTAISWFYGSMAKHILLKYCCTMSTHTLYMNIEFIQIREWDESKILMNCLFLHIWLLRCTFDCCRRVVVFVCKIIE